MREEGDPRLRHKPGRVKGRTVIPLTRQPDGMQAWKIVIPTSDATPEPRAHDGEECIYVLSGHIRFVLEIKTWCSDRETSPPSKPKCGTGSVVSAMHPPRFSSSSGDLANA